MRILDGSDIAFRFVHDDIHLPLVADHLAVKAYLVRKIDFRPQLRHNGPIDRHHTCLDELIGFAPRADARHGDITVQANLAVRNFRSESRIVLRIVGRAALFLSAERLAVAAAFALTVIGTLFVVPVT